MSVVDEGPGKEISEGMEDICCTEVFYEEWCEGFPASEGIVYNFAELSMVWHFEQVHGSSLSQSLS